MPGYGMNLSGPADWAAQQQAQQADNFNNIIRLFLSLKQNATEQDWKQKEYAAGQQRYDNSLAQQGVANKQWDARFGLDKETREADDVRQAGEAADRAENNKRARELQGDSIENNKLYRQSIIDAKKASEAAGAEERRNKLLASQHAALAANALKVMAGRKKAIADEMKLVVNDKSAAYRGLTDPNYMDNKLAPLRLKSEALDSQMASVLEAQRSALGGNAFDAGYVDSLNGVINGKDEQKNTGILGQLGNLLGLGSKANKSGETITPPQANANNSPEVTATNPKGEKIVLRNGKWVPYTAR